jgi:hypothetical protein
LEVLGKMHLTTPPPRKNVLDILPELAACATTTVRLHPRREDVLGLTESKVGGRFLWPKAEPWPRCDDREPPELLRNQRKVPHDAELPLLPVLQLRAVQFPELEFYPGTDLFQLLWCPLDHNETYMAKPFVFWRNSGDVTDPLLEMPHVEFANENYLITPCRLNPERVTEFPYISDLDEETRLKLETWDVRDALDGVFDSAETLYEWGLSVCPSNKLGGYVFWVQSPEVPRCSCSRRMAHLLTLTDQEFDGGTYPRWLPLEDHHVWGGPYEERMAVQCAPGWQFGAGFLYIFICRACKQWPIKAVYQR